MAGGLCCCICFDVLVLVMITAFFAFRMFVSYLGLFVCYIVQLTLIFENLPESIIVHHGLKLLSKRKMFLLQSKKILKILPESYS